MKTLNYLKKTAAGGAALASTVSTAAFAQIGSGISATADSAGATGATDLPTVINRIINILLFIIGAASVIFLIIGGIRYVVSGGDQSAVTNAKNTILYAIIGLVIAILAYAAVNFVFTQFTGTAA